ncbi:alpha/beta fold hydrolase [Herbaspirillum rubrisubalbicans]|uniref:Alpha/beta hydrolase n=1 Tax=Herbaspirillum rubrisubalbicans TaxID=80842 RepID=A0ABX9BX59_9BURK|nr:alpha/beta fold hydrolase [Herbaspirillum rubrisubalbicans]MCP1571755.1 pimeloyl-ACP methyl ester carboxylesterase [Herbaspirillum rubrisubalbicans]RAM62463.1 alpha/beta hydrolase [Herbaspirillum rubrisubalbicans]
MTSPCLREEFALACGGETLAGDLMRGVAGQPVHTLVLHGAGQGHRQRQWPLRETLVQQGCASAAIDFSGHGDSSAIRPNSLAKRLEEAQAALEQCTVAPRTVVGVSMSGEIALRLACRPANRIEHVVTMVGAIYDGAAFALPFGADFSAALRRPQSWRDAQVLDLIRTYPGRLTLIRASEDAVIPAEVAELVQRHATAAQCRIIDLPGVDHRISEHSARNAGLRTQLAALIAQ